LENGKTAVISGSGTSQPGTKKQTLFVPGLGCGGGTTLLVLPFCQDWSSTGGKVTGGAFFGGGAWP